METNTPETLDDLLKKLIGAIPEVNAAALISAEGLPIAVALPHGVEEARIAAITATLFSVSKKIIIEMNKGEFDQLFIKGSSGNLLILKSGSNGVLILSTTQDVPFVSIKFFTGFPPGDPGSAGTSGLVNL